MSCRILHAERPRKPLVHMHRPPSCLQTFVFECGRKIDHDWDYSPGTFDLSSHECVKTDSIPTAAGLVKAYDTIHDAAIVDFTASKDNTVVFFSSLTGLSAEDAAQRFREKYREVVDRKWAAGYEKGLAEPQLPFARHMRVLLEDFCVWCCRGGKYVVEYEGVSIHPACFVEAAVECDLGLEPVP